MYERSTVDASTEPGTREKSALDEGRNKRNLTKTHVYLDTTAKESSLFLLGADRPRDALIRYRFPMNTIASRACRSCHALS